MNVDDFVRAVGSAPEETVVRPVAARGEALAQAARRGVMLTDLLSHEVYGGSRDVGYRHLLGAPASKSTVERWQHQHPAHVLPADLRELVLRMNGIHLWANTETGRSYVGLAPLEEWELARTKMYGATADGDLLNDRYLAISYHEDGASFVTLDVQLGVYFLMDAAGPDTSTPIARNVDELLDWLWRNRIKPRR